MIKNVLLILTLSLFFGCKKPKETSFYFWKTTYKTSAYEKDYLNTLEVKKLYVRFFDINLKADKPIPIGEIDIQEKNTTQEIIPVIFITNETFKYLDKTAIAQLANNTIQEVKFIYPKISDKKIKEIQFDCDWTTSTRSKYFYFLNLVEIQNPALFVSATIRLHQIKDRKLTGVPPIKKGVLMYYATSNPLDVTYKNSILENDIAENYCKDIQNYPIPLDVAFPIYSWAIAENQLHEKRLINGIRNEDLKDTSMYKPLNNNLFLIKKDHYLNGIFLYQDYILKVEEISMQRLLTAKKNISSKLKNRELTTVFFQLDSSNLSHYTIEELKSISN